MVRRMSMRIRPRPRNARRAPGLDGARTAVHAPPMVRPPRHVFDAIMRTLPRAAAAALAVGSLVLAGVIVERNARYFHQNPSELADLGSYYGGTVAPLLTLAVFGIYLLAFLEQRRQVDLQEHELVQARHGAERQAFESTFYRVLEILRGVADTIEIHTGQPGQPLRGTTAFRDAVARVTERFLEYRQGEKLDLDLAIDRAVLETCFTDDSDFGHYFRTLEYLLRHLDQAGAHDATALAQLIAAQMGRYEAELVFAVGGTSRGQEFRPYLERFRMFDDAHIRKELIVLRYFYSASAFTM